MQGSESVKPFNINEHGNKEICNCNHCGKNFKNNSLLIAHTYQEHIQLQGGGEDTQPNFDLTCDECGESFSTKGALRYHKYEHIKKETVFVPSLAFKEESGDNVTNTAQDTKDDLDRTSGENMELDGKIDALTEKRDGVWTCKQCGKTDKTKFHLRRHAETHIDGFTFACNKCDKTFPHRYPLKNHILKNHPEERAVKPFNCHICKSEHKTKAAVRSHYFFKHHASQ